MDPSQRPTVTPAARQSASSAASNTRCFRRTRYASTRPAEPECQLTLSSSTIFLLVLLVVASRTYTTTPMYRSTTSVLIEEDRTSSVAGFNTQTPSDYDSEPCSRRNFAS